MHALALRILDLIAATLPHGPHIFDAFIAPLRLLHYPPAQPTAKRQLGASAHTDFGAITPLLQDEHAGLEVQDPGSGDWVGVAPDPAAYVVNVGDMLEMWTGASAMLAEVMSTVPRERGATTTVAMVA
jgi:isopenicillin N synthase-like dioxygenase